MNNSDKGGSAFYRDDGHVLLAALMCLVLLAFLSATALYLAGQDAPGIVVMREESRAQELADAAGELIVGWFHDATTAPPSLAGLLGRRQDDPIVGPSFFDMAGRSQFTGTADRPDVLLDAANPSDDRVLNGPPTGFSGSLVGLGHLEKVKFYAPLEPGLLGTLEVTASTRGRRPLARTISLQLGALNIPAIRAVVQTGQSLGAARSGGASPVLSHWGDVRVMGNLVVNHIGELVSKTTTAVVTGQSYETAGRLEDRWIDYWIGGAVSFLSPPSSSPPALPQNVHVLQHPVPGVRLDRWDYDLLKKTALRHGAYYRLDRVGRLHPMGGLESDPGLLPAEVLASSAVGQSHGLLFIDTLDGQAPGSDNLGTLVIDVDYVEALLVVQGNVLLRPSGSGRSTPVLSPSPEDTSALGTRIPVTLSDINMNGLLYAAGTITVERDIRLYGAVISNGTVIAGSATPRLEVWYNSDLGKGLFRGLPVVYRAPGSWRVKY